MDTKTERNLYRALILAKDLIPLEEKVLYYKEICKGCFYDVGFRPFKCEECHDGSNYNREE